MNRILRSSLLVACALLLVVGVVPATVSAHDGVDHRTPAEAERHRSLNDSHDKSGVKTSARLSEAKLAVCQARQMKITGIMTRSVNRAQKQLKLFNTTSGRVQAFYAKSGQTLSNYTELVAAVNAAKSVAEAKLASLKTHAFDCTGDDPKGHAAAFTSDLTSFNTSLKEYRSTLKNLIKAVRQDA